MPYRHHIYARTRNEYLVNESHAGGYTTFYGAANPPATYGGVGGTTLDKARYSYVVPATFKEDIVSKARVLRQ